MSIFTIYANLNLIVNPAGPLKFSHLQTQRPAGTINSRSQGYTGYDKLDDVVTDHIQNVLTGTGGRVHGENRE